MIVTQQFAQDIAIVHGLIGSEIRSSTARRNNTIRLAPGNKELIEALSQHILELSKMRKRFIRRLRTAQKGLSKQKGKQYE